MAKELDYFTSLDGLTFPEANRLTLEDLEREYRRIWLLTPVDATAEFVKSNTLYNIFTAYANQASLEIRKTIACYHSDVELLKIKDEKIEELQNGVEMKRLTDKLDVIKDILEDAISEIEEY